MAPTKTKKEVRYRKAAQRQNGEKKCGNCAMFVARTIANGCTLVRGTIERDYVCDEWEGKPKGVRKIQRTT